VRRIANTLHRLNKGGKVIGVLDVTAFVDETGHPRDPKAKVFGMAASFAPEKIWRALERQWIRLLEEANIKQFHASDCETRGGVFIDWPKEKRHKLYKKFALIVARHKLTHVSCVIDMQAYRLLSHDFDPVRESPYQMAFVACLEAVQIEADRALPREERIACIIEMQEQYRAVADATYQALVHVIKLTPRFLPSATFAPKDAFVPFQAADMVAYEFGKFHLNRVYDPARPPRKSFVKMIGKTRAASYFYDETHLRKMKSQTAQSQNHSF